MYKMYLLQFLESFANKCYESFVFSGFYFMLNVFQIYNVFPWLAPLLKNWRDLIKNVNENMADASKVIADLKDSLDPEACKCYVDAFLSHKKHLEVSLQSPVQDLVEET